MAVLHLEQTGSRSLRGSFDLELSKGELIHVYGNNQCSRELFGLIIGSSRRHKGNILPQDQIGVARWHESVGLITEQGFPASLNNLDRLSSFCKKAYRQWDQNRFSRLSHELSLPQKRPLRRFSTAELLGCSAAVALSHRAELLLVPPYTKEDLPQAVRSVVTREVRTKKAGALFHVSNPDTAAQEGTRHLLLGRVSILLDCTNAELEGYQICSTTISRVDRLPPKQVVALFHSGKIAAKCIIEKDSAIDPTLGRVRDLELSDLTRWGEPV